LPDLQKGPGTFGLGRVGYSFVLDGVIQSLKTPQSRKEGEMDNMQRYIALLRGINVSGQKRIQMSDLKIRLEEAGLHHVVTYLQSGNVVFDAAETDPARIQKGIETQILKSFGFVVTVLLRSKDEWRQVLSSNPFLKQRNEDPDRLYVTFLSAVPPQTVVKDIRPPHGVRDEFEIRGKEVYLMCRDGYGRTKLSNAFFEKKLMVNATTRNWRTVIALEQISW